MTAAPPTTPIDDDWYRSFAPRGTDGCWYYASLPSKQPPGGRFDLPTPQGTCYWGESVEAAFRERIRREGPDVNTIPEDLLGFVITRRRIRRDALVDLTHKDATKTTGITGDVVTGADYAAARALAEQWRGSGHDGVHYRSRFALNHRAAALFGDQGEHAPAGDAELERISDVDAAAQLGITVLRPRPRSGNIPIIGT